MAFFRVIVHGSTHVVWASYLRARAAAGLGKPLMSQPCELLSWKGCWVCWALSCADSRSQMVTIGCSMSLSAAGWKKAALFKSLTNCLFSAMPIWPSFGLDARGCPICWKGKCRVWGRANSTSWPPEESVVLPIPPACSAQSQPGRDAVSHGISWLVMLSRCP